MIGNGAERLPKYLVERFSKEGFLLIPELLTSGEVQELRAQVEDIFDEAPSHPGDQERVRFDVMNRYAGLRSLFFHPTLAAALRSLLGENFVYLPETALHNAIFTNWHKDTTSQERVGHRFQWEPEYKMLEVAFYLQDNDPYYGGGLDVVPGSHLGADRHVKPSLRARVESRMASRGLLMRSYSGVFGQPAYSIPSRAGDLLLFHFRIDHRGTPARSPAAQKLRRKRALFTACSANTKHAAMYTDYLRSRDDYLYLRSHRYCDDVRELATAAGVGLG